MRKYIVQGLVLYAVLFIVFSFAEKGLDTQQYIIMGKRLITPIIAIVLIQYFAYRPLFSKVWLSALLMIFLWGIFIPMLYVYSNGSVYKWNPRHDIMWGTYLGLLCMLFQSVLIALKDKCPLVINRINAIFFSVLVVVATVIPLAELGYFLIYHVTLSDDAIFAIQNTYPAEAIGYLKEHMGTAGIIVFIGTLLLEMTITYYLCAKQSSIKLHRKILLFMIALLPVLTLHIFEPKNINETLFFSAWNRVSAYKQEQNLFSQGYDERYQCLQLTNHDTLAQTTPGTVIVIIGESACRDNMKVYNSSYPYDDTPWMEQQKYNSDFTIYQHVYSSWPQTVPSLMRACTEMSQYNDKQFNKSITWVDIAKKAGYQTYWYSNQGGMGQFDAPITLIMKTTDHYASPVINDRLHYDEDLLPFLNDVNPNQNNFIVIHLKGSHGPYESRYPKEGKVFDSSKREGNYANTILYTDNVLKDIFEYAKDNLHLQAMVYFSDHGESMKYGHGPDIKTFDQVRIPMFIYLSPEYQKNYPEKSALLEQRAASYFTNDMIYNTLSGILNAPSNHYDAREDLSSPSYAFNRDNLWTFKHTVKISEDPYDN